MRVSVVIANHNYAEFVGEAVESALSQTYPEVEVVVVDDGSTDGSRALLAGYEGDGVRLVLQENRGHAGAFNAGYRLSVGDLVIFLDADDVLLPDAAEAAVAVAGPQIAHVHWPVEEVDAEGVPTGEVTPVADLAEGDLRPQLLADGPLQWSSSPTSGNAWSREYLSHAMPIPEAEFRMGADAYLITLAPLYGELRALRTPHTLYRRHRASHSSQAYDEVLGFDLAVARKLFPLAARHVRALGLDADPARWEERNWSFRLARSLEEIDALVGRGVPFVLIDGMELSMERSSGRQVIPFLERDGEYWGNPENDTHAIEELGRLRRAGARFVVLAWPAFWWTDAYPGFIEHLQCTYACRLKNDRLRIFELTRDAESTHAG